jgi:hypothetical protein
MIQYTPLLLCREISEQSNTYSECVFVALDIHNEMRMAHIIIYDLLGSTISKKKHNFWKISY